MPERILYLHGFASGPGSHKAVFFAARLREIGLELEVPDLAAGDFEHLTISGQLQVLTRLAKGEPVLLVGSSMGGYLAALYAARHPEVPRLVLLAPAFGFARRWPEALGAAQVERWKSNGWLEVFHYGERRQRRLSYRLIEDSARYEDYPDARQPTLILHGAADTVVPVASSRQFAAAHPHARLEVLDSDHELLNVLDTLWERLREFLAIA